MVVTKGFTECAPIEVGYDETRLEALHKHLQQLMDDKKIQGSSYCISKDGKVFAHGAVGKLCYRPEDERPMLPTTIHHIASETKTFTAIAIMQLIEDGKARLTTPVGDILPQFAKKPYNQINLYHLLTHTSGLWPDDGCFEDGHRKGPWAYIEELDERFKAGEKDLDWLSEALTAGFRKEPGEQWQYCSFGFVVLGLVIEKLSGQFAHDYIMNHIVRPLDMKDTGFDVIKEHAKRFMIRDKRYEEHLNKIISGEIEEGKEKNHIWDFVPQTGGGLYSTPYDLVRYGNMLLNKGWLGDVRIIGRTSIEKMTTCQLHNIPDYCWNANNKDRRYGIGFDMKQGLDYIYSDQTFYHEGSGACALVCDPKENMVASFFVPWVRSEDWFGEAIYNTINVIWSGLI